MGVRHGPGSQGFGTIKLSSSTPAAEVWVPPLVIQSVAKSLTLVERISSSSQLSLSELYLLVRMESRTLKIAIM